MFKRLHLQLTLLYLAVALALIGLVGGGTYLVLRSYFQHTTDLALEHKAAHEFTMLGSPLPPELITADRDWSLQRGRDADVREGKGEEHDDDDHDKKPSEQRASDLAYDGELAAIFVLPLDTTGRLLFNPNPAAPPIAPEQPALQAALARGSDRRTVQFDDGVRVRLLTYRVANERVAALQLGRTLNDQDRTLSQLFGGLLVLSSVSAVLMGAGSWWLAGRSLRPAQQAWERQQAFIANASHELRTPLTLMRASAEVAQRSLPPEDQDNQQLLDDVLHECDHMGRLVEDLLLLSRLDAGRLKLDRVAIPLAELFAEMQRQVGRLAAERRISLMVDPVSGSVWGDPTRLRQVLLILLDNALRYTPPGGNICLSACPQGHSIRISVTDSGSGIAPDHVPHVFERFYRADSAHGANGGSGLGLSIARALVEAQQGRISLTSAVGRGTQVIVGLTAV